LSSGPFRVYLITNLAGLPEAATLPPDRALAIQLRDAGASGRALYAAAAALRARGHRVYINDRLDVALAAGCEGIHLGGSSLRVEEARRLAGELPCAQGERMPRERAERLRVGVSTHDIEDVEAARVAGADFAVFGPVYTTPGKGPPVGLASLQAAAALGLPLYALGGVDLERAQACLAAGAVGVAAIRAGCALARALACPPEPHGRNVVGRL
jgi:thiamine-phosphate pyrophosphorylase